MKIGIIGAGKVGVTLGKCIVDAGIKDSQILGYFNRTYEKAREAAVFTNTRAFDTLKELCQSSDTLFVTVSDDQIEEVWDRIDKNTIRNKIICHFSGSISSVVFSGREKWGISSASAHPVFAFNDRFSSFTSFQNVCFTFEGDPPAVESLKQLFQSMGHRGFSILSKDKEKYHAAASMVSNHVVGLLKTGFELMEECGFDENVAREIFTPLIMNNVRNVCEKGCTASLTGPVERGDKKTVEKHLRVVKGENLEIYLVLAKKILEIAKQKHPEKEYAGLEKILEAYNEKQRNDI